MDGPPLADIGAARARALERRTRRARIVARDRYGPTAGASAILSPDGSLLAFVAQAPNGQPLLHVRRLDQLQATPLSGTDGVGGAFFLPDGQWLGFFADTPWMAIPSEQRNRVFELRHIAPVKK